MRGDVDPALWTTRRTFGVAGGPEEVVLTAAGLERAFSVGAQVKSGAPAKALEELAAHGGTATLTERRGTRHKLTEMGRRFDQITWGYLREKGYVESFYSEGEDGVRLTSRGVRAVERGHEERASLLQRIGRQSVRNNPARELKIEDVKVGDVFDYFGETLIVKRVNKKSREVWFDAFKEGRAGRDAFGKPYPPDVKVFHIRDFSQLKQVRNNPPAPWAKVFG